MLPLKPPSLNLLQSRWKNSTPYGPFRSNSMRLALISEVRTSFIVWFMQCAMEFKYQMTMHVWQCHMLFNGPRYQFLTLKDIYLFDHDSSRSNEEREREKLMEIRNWQMINELFVLSCLFAATSPCNHWWLRFPIE